MTTRKRHCLKVYYNQKGDCYIRLYNKRYYLNDFIFNIYYITYNYCLECINIKNGIDDHIILDECISK